jgi:hypothetical protein
MARPIPRFSVGRDLLPECLVFNHAAAVGRLGMVALVSGRRVKRLISTADFRRPIEGKIVAG